MRFTLVVSELKNTIFLFRVILHFISGALLKWLTVRHSNLEDEDRVLVEKKEHKGRHKFGDIWENVPFLSKESWPLIYLCIM